MIFVLCKSFKNFMVCMKTFGNLNPSEYFIPLAWSIFKWPLILGKQCFQIFFYVDSPAFHSVGLELNIQDLNACTHTLASRLSLVFTLQQISI